MHGFLLIIILILTLLTQLFYYFKLRKLEARSKLLIDEKVEEVIIALRGEIPMGETFLKGALFDRIKQKAQTKASELLPKFKKEVFSSNPDLIFIPWILALVAALAIEVMLKLTR